MGHSWLLSLVPGAGWWILVLHQGLRCSVGKNLYYHSSNKLIDRSSDNHESWGFSVLSRDLAYSWLTLLPQSRNRTRDPFVLCGPEFHPRRTFAMSGFGRPPSSKITFSPTPCVDCPRSIARPPTNNHPVQNAGAFLSITMVYIPRSRGWLWRD